MRIISSLAPFLQPRNSTLKTFGYAGKCNIHDRDIDNDDEKAQA